MRAVLRLLGEPANERPSLDRMTVRRIERMLLAGDSEDSITAALGLPVNTVRATLIELSRQAAAGARRSRRRAA